MKKYLFLASLGIFYACSSDSIDSLGTLSENISDGCSHKISEQQALNTLRNCMAGTSPSRSADMDIANINAITAHDLNIKSDITSDTLFYVVNFADSSGYALLAADDRTTPIYAIIDNGSFQKSINAGTNRFHSALLKRSAQILINDVSDYSISRPRPLDPWLPPQRPDEPFIPVEDSIAPLIPVKWGPDAPYNKFIQPTPLPSLVVAVAQVFSYYKVPSYVEWIGKNDHANYTCDINWEEILQNAKTANPTSNAKVNNQIAHLMGYLENQFEPDYSEFPDFFGIDSVAVSLDLVTEWISNLPHFKATQFEHFDIEKVRMAIMTKKCSIVVGYEDKRVGIMKDEYDHGGHAFVIDGYLGKRYIRFLEMPDLQELYHCNWGWNGDMNGFYIAELFSDEELMMEDEGINHSHKDFTHHLELQYSIISSTN